MAQLFKNTNDVVLTEQKFTLLSNSIFDLSVDTTDFALGEVFEIPEWDIDDFPKDLLFIIEKLKHTTPNLQGITFNHEAVYTVPSDGVDLRYTIVSRTPGTFGGRLNELQEPGQGRLNYKFKLLDILDDLDNPGYGVLVFGQYMDNVIRLTPWSKTYTTANRVANVIEDLIPDYMFYFKKRGAQQIRFERRGEDMFQNFENNTFYGCPLNYYVRTLKIKKVYEKKLEEIIVEFHK